MTGPLQNGHPYEKGIMEIIRMKKNSPQRQFRDFRKEDSWLQPERMGVIYKLVQVNYGSTFMKHDPCIWALPVFFSGVGGGD